MRSYEEKLVPVSYEWIKQLNAVGCQLMWLIGTALLRYRMWLSLKILIYYEINILSNTFTMYDIESVNIVHIFTRCLHIFTP